MKMRFQKFYRETLRTKRESNSSIFIKQQRNEHHVQNYPLRLPRVWQPKKLWAGVEIVSTPHGKLLP